jgi:hypothetical protein
MGWMAGLGQGMQMLGSTVMESAAQEKKDALQQRLKL